MLGLLSGSPPVGREGGRTGQREKRKCHADMTGVSGDSPGSPGALVALEVKGLAFELLHGQVTGCLLALGRGLDLG